MAPRFVPQFTPQFITPALKSHLDMLLTFYVDMARRWPIIAIPAKQPNVAMSLELSSTLHL